MYRITPSPCHFCWLVLDPHGLIVASYVLRVRAEWEADRRNEMVMEVAV
jgi:hypothetical protein